MSGCRLLGSVMVSECPVCSPAVSGESTSVGQAPSKTTLPEPCESIEQVIDHTASVEHVSVMIAPCMRWNAGIPGDARPHAWLEELRVLRHSASWKDAVRQSS